MHAVNIRITSSTQEPGAKPQHNMQQYKGMMAEKNGKCYVIYHEDEQSGLEGTKTTVKWDEDSVLLMRSGAVEHRQEFRRDFVDISTYNTPYIKIRLKTVTDYVYNHQNKDGWHLQMNYKLYHEDAPYGDMKIIMDIEEDTQSGN